MPRAERPRNAPSSSSTVEVGPGRFTLSGPSLALDPQVHAYRRDVADIALAGQLFAPHYARPVIRVTGPDAADLIGEPSAESEPIRTLAAGEEFAILDISGRWAWGYARRDHLVGYVLSNALIEVAASE